MAMHNRDRTMWFDTVGSAAIDSLAGSDRRGHRSSVVPFHWSVKNAVEVDGTAVVTLNYHSERYMDSTFSSRNLSGDDVYTFDVAKELADFECMCAFEKVNRMGELQDLCDTANQDLKRMLREIAGKYREPADIDGVAFSCFADATNPEFTSLLRVFVKNEALIKLINGKYVGNDICRY